MKINKHYFKNISSKKLEMYPTERFKIVNFQNIIDYIIVTQFLSADYSKFKDSKFLDLVQQIGVRWC